MNIDNLFLKHRTCYDFSDRAVSNELLQEIYDVSKFGSTSFNGLPLRVIFVTSAEQRSHILECMMPGNVEKTKTAPVTAIFAYDMQFYDKLDKLFPPMPNVASFFTGNKELAEETAFRNSTLQAAYFMIVARSKGVDCGPMSGFNKDMVNEKFFKDTNWKVNFICNLGYKKEGVEYDTLPRLDFTEACNFI
jgi:3-hydroxypropanoate dehydrogenase